MNNLKKIEDKINTFSTLNVDKMNSIKGGSASCGSRMVIICKSVSFETVDKYFELRNSDTNS